MRIGHVSGFLIACIVALGSANAQSTRPRTPKPARQPSRTALLAQLDLTDSQRGRERAIHSKYAPMIILAKRDSRDRAATLRARELSEVRAILTPWQQQKLDDAMNLGPAKSRGGKGLGPVRIAIPR